MKTYSTLLLFLFFFNVAAQKFQPCLIEKQDGTRLNGLAKMPESSDKQVQFKSSEASDKQTLQSDDLKRIILYGEDTVELSREYIVHAGKQRGPLWLQKHISGFCSLYTTTGSDMLVRAGAFTNTKTTYSFYVMRDGEQGVTPIGSYISGAINVRANAPFVKAASEYFKDYPQLVTRIKGNEFKLLECPAVVMEYNKWKK